MILCWNWFVYSWKFYWMSGKNISCEFQIFWNFDQKCPFEQFKTHQNYNLTRDQSFFRVGLHRTEQNAYCIEASDLRATQYCSNNFEILVFVIFYFQMFFLRSSFYCTFNQCLDHWNLPVDINRLKYVPVKCEIP